MRTTLADYQLIARNLPASIDRFAEQPQIRREIDYYLSRIKEIKSVDDFMADERVYRFAMEAAGLSDMIYARAFMRKVLTEGVDSPDAFANKLADTRFREFARRYNFARYGETATVFDRARQGAVDDYLRQKLEEDAGQTNEGVRLALYFRRKAPKIRNGYDILADRALMKVAETIIGHSLARGDVDRNAKLVEARLPIKDFKDPEKLEKFLQRFTVMWDLNGPGPQAASAPNALLIQPLEAGIGENLLLSLQQLKLGGH